MDENNKLAEELIKNYYDALMKYCFALKVSGHDAEDFVSETFKRMWENIELIASLQPKAQKAWLYTTVSNLIKDSYKSKPPLPTEDNILENVPCENKEIERVVEDCQFENIIKTLKENASEEERKLLELIIEKNKTYDQIAKELNVNSVTLRTRIWRLRKKLKPVAEELLKK